MNLVNFIVMTLRKNHLVHIWAVLLLLPLLLVGQETGVRTGVINTVALDSVHRMTYYLPSYYSSDRPMPVIYIFDPSGSDDMAVKTFMSSAEKYGYVLASSSGIKNGTYQENYRQARYLFENSDAMFSIDSINRFTAGFSGGARLASAIAGLSKNVRGVVASGAGVTTRYLTQERVEPFVFIGIGGDEGFNYAELGSTGLLLNTLKYPNEIIFFDGGHEWPPQVVIEKAVRDLTVKMHSRGQLKRNEEELLEMYYDQIAYNRQLRAEGHLVWAYDDLEKMRDWYSFLGKDKEIKQEMKAVKSMNGYRTQRRARNYIDELEPLYLQEYLDFLIKDISVGDLEALGYWDQEMKHLEKSFASSKEQEYRKMDIRIRSMLRVIGAQAKKQLEEPGYLKQLLFTNIFLTLTDKKDHDAYLEVLRLAVALGEYDIALYYTDELFASGFKDISRLRDYPGIALLRIQPEFGEILEKHGFEARF